VRCSAYSACSARLYFLGGSGWAIAESEEHALGCDNRCIGCCRGNRRAAPLGCLREGGSKGGPPPCVGLRRQLLHPGVLQGSFATPLAARIGHG
jgi:hypothetical protein